MELYLPEPEELKRLHRGDRFRDWHVPEGALPGKILYLQGVQHRDTAAVAYRWSVPYLMVLPEAGMVVGTIGGKGLFDGEEEVEIAYEVAPAERRKGYAAQAMDLLQCIARKDNLQLLAHVEPQNTASRRLLSRTGFRCETIFRLPDSLDLERWRWLPD